MKQSRTAIRPPSTSRPTNRCRPTPVGPRHIFYPISGHFATGQIAEFDAVELPCYRNKQHGAGCSNPRCGFPLGGQQIRLRNILHDRPSSHSGFTLATLGHTTACRGEYLPSGERRDYQSQSSLAPGHSNVSRLLLSQYALRTRPRVVVVWAPGGPRPLGEPRVLIRVSEHILHSSRFVLCPSIQRSKMSEGVVRASACAKQVSDVRNDLSESQRVTRPPREPNDT
ncbi:hypothetical protein P154DRAFT_96563 [Amniculicola lignicola CBS 123094]|uniref:Uncharacterized protein n=1 Tax=Amniculicola lignicola CBS 123094 TaxID=1392246 RepID=A0A6A5W227_9PLEO|nr:hypothetical protein P154DRAFT_96563 [Amniculicola lignicola CBS 123094]